MDKLGVRTSMNSWMVLAGFLPLLIFVIVDSFCGLKKGILAAIIAAILELFLSLYLFKTVDMLTIGALALVVVMGAAAWKMRSPTVFKMQPVVVGLALSGVLLISYAIGQPILVVMITKYQEFLPGPMAMQVNNPLFLKWLSLSTLYCGLALLLQSFLVGWAAVKLNNWLWIAFRGIGFYVFFIGAALLARYHIFP